MSNRRSDIIAEEAAEWLIALEYPEPATKAEFVQWLRTSPEHVSEFLAVVRLWETLPEVSTQPSIDELVALAAGEQNVVTLGEAGGPPVDTPPGEVRSGTRHQPARRSWFGWAAAATLAAVVIGGAMMLMPAPEDPNLYSTSIGEQTSIPLPDGSIVTLNTRSTLRVDYSQAYRDVHLLSGEALFEVAKDAGRPFRVLTEHAVIQAVGTLFNVREGPSDVTVTVVEGMVDVTAKRKSWDVSERGKDRGGRVVRSQESAPPKASRLSVGQQAKVSAHSGIVAVAETTVTNAIAWQQRRLVFESLSLQQVIDEFNRYNDPPLRLDDPELAQLPISGVFRANDRESFVQFLAKMQLAESHTHPDGTIVLRGVKRDR